MRIAQIVPDATSLLALEPEELAGVLLEHLNTLPATDRQSLSRHNFLHNPHVTFSEYPSDYRERIGQAFAEAWQWLEREGLLVHRSGSGTAEWFDISRRGTKLPTRADVDAYRHASLLPREQLHPAIALRVWSTFLRGDYDIAVLQAFKAVEVAVRQAGMFSDEDIGTDLMRKAFNPINGPLADHGRLKAERQAMSDVFAGALGLYKNPHSHRNVVLADPREAVEMIVLASHLLRIVDGRAEAAGSSSAPRPG